MHHDKDPERVARIRFSATRFGETAAPAPSAVIRLLAIGAMTHYKAPEVLLMFGRIAAFVLCPALLAAGGCVRSDDGTVIVPSRMDVRRVWDKVPPGTAPSRQIVPDVFPPPPPAPPGPGARRYSRPAAPSVNPQLSEDPSEPEPALACHNVSEPGRRVRVVCD